MGLLEQFIRLSLYSLTPKAKFQNIVSVSTVGDERLWFGSALTAPTERGVCSPKKGAEAL